MHAFIINIDSATDRWASVAQTFAKTQLTVSRIAAVDGYALKLPHAEYAEGLYWLFHGRPTSPGHVGCYLSHVKAMQAFLATADAHALIAEDDLTLHPDFEACVGAALAYSQHWNILRLTGLSKGRPVKMARLSPHHFLCVSLGRLKGTGAYLVDRTAARILVERLLPMRLPIDHAMDREWFFGLRAAYIHPFPASQEETGFRSSIQCGRSLKLPKWRRYFTTYPYQAVNELSRWLFRAIQCAKTRLALAGRA